jgi:hypothetical protein
LNLSNKVAELCFDFFFDTVKLLDELFVARYPVDDWVTKSCLILSFLMALIEIFLGTFLEVKSVLTAALDALPADFQALVDFSQRLLLVVKTVHRASCAFVIHYVKFFVQERVESSLSFPHPLVKEIKCFFVHVIYHLLVFRYLEEISDFLMLAKILV